MIGWWLGLAAAILPGRYAGTGPEGAPVSLHLQADGQVELAGQVWRWQPAGDRLRLEREGATLEWQVAIDATGTVRLTGGPPGPLLLRPVAFDPPPPPPPERPAALVGAWIHRASGGSLALELAADGQAVLRGDEASELPTVRGVWRVSGGDLLLAVDGGPPLRYTARREGSALVLAGEALPTAVAFEPAGRPGL